MNSLLNEMELISCGEEKNFILMCKADCVKLRNSNNRRTLHRLHLRSAFTVLSILCLILLIDLNRSVGCSSSKSFRNKSPHYMDLIIPLYMDLTFVQQDAAATKKVVDVGFEQNACNPPVIDASLFRSFVERKQFLPLLPPISVAFTGANRNFCSSTPIEFSNDQGNHHSPLFFHRKVVATLRGQHRTRDGVKGRSHHEYSCM